MDQLPEELVLHILSYLDPRDVLASQSISRKFLSLGRDNNLWRISCFNHSRSEAVRRRQQQLSAQEDTLAALRRAFEESHLPGLHQSSPHGIERDGDGSLRQSTRPRDRERSRAMANWEPGYPSENPSFYQEYIHRHARLSLRWLPSIREDSTNTNDARESVGMAVIEDVQEGTPPKVLAPLDDGSVCIWDVTYGKRQGQKPGSLIARSNPGAIYGESNGGNVTPPAPLTTETGAVDNVSVDSAQQKAYIANLNELNEVDLNTLQVIRRHQFPFAITALSEARRPTPLTVGTNMTLHLLDTRVSHPWAEFAASARTELIGGTPPPADNVSFKVSAAHATLSQPGPLSILHLPNTDSIWVAGRFTSLINYDRRYWPRIQGTIFSGARLSSLSYLPYPYVSRQFDLLRHPNISVADRNREKSSTGTTLIAAGEYKGKGSLELYGFPPTSQPTVCETSSLYRNRQTASKSRLLCVCPHGARLVFSDGDGNLKWVERDGTTLVRSFNINTDVPEYANPSALPSSSLFYQAESDQYSDIVQKILPLRHPIDSLRVNNEDLLVWTGDGRLGIVTFGRQLSRSEDEEAAASIAEEEEAEKERIYGLRMREALERQADETRFVRGLGLGYGTGGHMGFGW